VELDHLFINANIRPMMKTMGEEHRLPKHITQHLEHLLSGQQDAKVVIAKFRMGKFRIVGAPRTCFSEQQLG
jgi:hypothetical protein